MSIGQIKSNCKTATPLTRAESCAKQEGKVSALIVTGLNAYFPLEETDFTDELGTHFMNPVLTGFIRLKISLG